MWAHEAKKGLQHYCTNLRITSSYLSSAICELRIMVIRIEERKGVWTPVWERVYRSLRQRTVVDIEPWGHHFPE